MGGPGLFVIDTTRAGGGSGTTGTGSSSRTPVSVVPSTTDGRVNDVEDSRRQALGDIGSQWGGSLGKVNPQVHEGRTSNKGHSLRGARTITLTRALCPRDMMVTLHRPLEWGAPS